MQGSFTEGKAVILTLKDQEVLDEGGDVLVNVNMVDDEKYQKNVIIKRTKPGYDAYEEENEEDLYDLGLPKNSMLRKYDEEIDGAKKANFSLGIDNAREIEKRRTEMIKKKLENKRLVTLKLAEPKLASDYFTEEELGKFKKTKKKVSR